MEGNVAATYTLVYRFLKRQSQNKAAEAVKNAARSIIVLRDDIEQEGLPLEDIVKEWRAKQNTKSGDVDSSSENSESSDGSSSNSSSNSSSEDTSDSESDDKSESDNDDTSDNSDDSGEETKAKEPLKKAAERDTSATLSSTGENTRGAAKLTVTRVPEKTSSKETSASSDGEASSSSSDSSSGSDSSDEGEANTNAKAPANNTKTTEDESSSSSESSSDSESSEQNEDVHTTKKRKTSGNGPAVTTTVIAGAPQRKENPSPKVQERFQRVKVQNLVRDQMLDNGYEARGGATNDYGQRAHRDLVVTRGAGFRKEKNKKKRGSYRGGEITMENHSIKFNF